MTNTLVLVSDDLLLGSRVKEGALGAGHSVVVAATEDALRKALAADPRPGAVLIALNLRRSDAYALIRLLKTEYVGLPVLAFAGHAEREKHAMAREAGADMVAANSSVSLYLPALLTRLLSGEKSVIAEDVKE
jgi:DNA-binding response OmpR family regulator